MGGLRRRGADLPGHHGTFGKPLGLLGVHRDVLQTRSGTPARSPAVHDAGAPGHALRLRKPRLRGHRRQRHELAGQRLLHPVPVLDHHPPGTASGDARRRAAHRRQHMGRPGRRSRRGPGLHLHRHVLVLGRRGRGLRALVDVHGAGRVADAQMGGAGRRTPLLALDRADRLPDGTLDRRAHPQPALHPRAGLHLLLPQDRHGDLARHRPLEARVRGDDRLRQQHHHPLHRLDRGADRHAVRQHVRPAGQLGHHALRAGADHRPGMGRMGRPQTGPRAAQHHPALDDHDSRRLFVLRLGDHPRR